MLTGLEINLQIALVALGLAMVVGVYLYSRFRDRRITDSRSVANSRNEPSVSSEYESVPGSYMTGGEYQPDHDIPDYLAGIDSGETSPEDRVGNPWHESDWVPPDENHAPANTESDLSEYPQQQSIQGLAINADDEGDSETPVLVEQVDLEEMVGDAGEETTANRQSEDTAYVDIPDSSTALTEEVESEISAEPPYEEHYAEAVDSTGLFFETEESGDEKIDPTSRQTARKAKSHGFGIFKFNRFRNRRPGSDIQESDAEFAFGSSDGFDKPDACTTRIIGESGEVETPYAGIHEKLEEVTSTRFEYPEIQGFNRLGQVDYWVKFHGGGNIGKELLEVQYRELFNSLEKPTRLYGIRTSDQKWVNVLGRKDSASFVTLIVSLQLVDSAGAITRSELNRFTGMVTQFSERMGKDITFMAPLESALGQAAALSECVRLFDYPSMVLVVPETKGSHIRGREIDFCANQLGLEAYKTNYYVRTKVMRKNKMPLYGVANMSSEGTFDFENMENLNSPGLVFFFRPLLHQAPGSVLAEMVSTARSFAGRIGAKTITPDGDELTVVMATEIRASIEKRSREMAVCGLKSGSDTILRIFESEIFASE